VLVGVCGDESVDNFLHDPAEDRASISELLELEGHMRTSSLADSAAELEEAIRLSRAGQLKEGLKAALAVTQRLRPTGDGPMLRRALNTLAICQAAQGRFIEAVSHCLDVYELARAANDQLAECHALATLAASAGMILDTDEGAYPVLRHCLEAAVGLGDITLETRVRGLLGIRLGTMQRFDESERENNAALKLAMAHGGFLTPRSLLLLNLAVLAVKRIRAAAEPDRPALAAVARARTMEAMAIAQQEGNAVLVARVHYNFGDIDRVMGDPASALVQFDHALSIEEDLRSPNFLSSLLMARSEVLLSLARWDDALAASMRAFHHAEQHRPSGDTTTAAANLVALYSRRGEPELAAAWQVRADAETADFQRESRLVREKLVELWSQQSRWAAAA